MRDGQLTINGRPVWVDPVEPLVSDGLEVGDIWVDTFIPMAKRCTSISPVSFTNIEGGVTGAPSDAKYITQTPNATLSNEQALSLLSTGLLKSTTTTGILSIAVGDTDYALPATVALKAPLASPTFTGVVTYPTPFTLGATSVTATGTELNYMVGVTSGVQAQLNGKVSGSGTSSGTNTGDQNIFSSVAVSGQTTVSADTTSDTLTLVAGTNVTITTDASTDSITINSSGGGGGGAPADAIYIITESDLDLPNAITTADLGPGLLAVNTTAYGSVSLGIGDVDYPTVDTVTYKADVVNAIHAGTFTIGGSEISTALTALSGTNTGDQNIFSTIEVSGQPTVSSDTTTGILTLVAGTNITITTDDTADSITISSSGGGGVSDGDKGDITVSGSGATWAIDNGAVTLAKMADISTGSLIYRKTGGTGAPEVNTLATLKTDLGLTGTNSGDQTITLTGDVTGSGTGSFSATIAASSVSLAKMADMATTSILGRNTAGTGAPEVLSAATTRTLLSLNNVENTALSTWAGATNITTLGTITSGTWSGTEVAVNKGGTGLTSTTAYAVLCGGTTSTNPLQSVASVGTSGQVLTSNGAGALPTFQDAAGGGLSHPQVLARTSLGF